MKKIIALLCVLTTLFSITSLSTSAVVEYEAVHDGYFPAALYFIDDRAFLIPQDKLVEAMTEEGAIIELPTETSGKTITVYCLNLYSKTNHWQAESTTTVDGPVALSTAEILKPTLTNYYFYFKSSEKASYNTNLEIGTTEQPFRFWCYGTDEQIIFIDAQEINTLINDKTLYLSNDTLVKSQRIYSEYWDSKYLFSQGSYSAEVPKNLMLTFDFLFRTSTTSNTTENYKIYVNYKESFLEKFNRFINCFLEFFAIFRNFFIKLEF